jgi:hypothetical protein
MQHGGSHRLNSCWQDVQRHHCVCSCALLMHKLALMNPQYIITNISSAATITRSAGHEKTCNQRLRS